jgi:hypothetical protein
MLHIRYTYTTTSVLWLCNCVYRTNTLQFQCCGCVTECSIQINFNFSAVALLRCIQYKYTTTSLLWLYYCVFSTNTLNFSAVALLLCILYKYTTTSVLWLWYFVFSTNTLKLLCNGSITLYIQLKTFQLKCCYFFTACSVQIHCTILYYTIHLFPWHDNIQ